MDPVLIHLGPLKIHWYGVLMALGFLAGLANWTALARRRGWTFAFCSDLLLWIMVAGIVGGRLAYVVSEFDYYAAHPVMIVRVDEGGLIYYGGFLGAAAAVFLFSRSRRVGFVALGDFVMTSLPLAHAFGRVGCFLNGCCHGRISHGPLGVAYPAGSLPWSDQVADGLTRADAARSLPVLPVQLFEAAHNLALFVLLAWLYRRRPRDGVVAGVYLTVYPVGRFALEYLRGDPRARWSGFSVAQWTSVALFAAGVALLAWAFRRTRNDGGAPTS